MVYSSSLHAASDDVQDDSGEGEASSHESNHFLRQILQAEQFGVPVLEGPQLGRPVLEELEHLGRDSMES